MTPRGDNSTSVQPVKVSEKPGWPPFQMESPCRHRISVWMRVSASREGDSLTSFAMSETEADSGSTTAFDDLSNGGRVCRSCLPGVGAVVMKHVAPWNNGSSNGKMKLQVAMARMRGFAGCCANLHVRSCESSAFGSAFTRSLPQNAASRAMLLLSCVVNSDTS